MTDNLQQLLKIPNDRLDAINEVLLNPDTKIIKAFMDVVAKYGTPEEINRKAAEARKLENLYRKSTANQPRLHQGFGMAIRAWQKAGNSYPLRITGKMYWAILRRTRSSRMISR